MTTTEAPAITDEAIERMRSQLNQPWPTRGWNSAASSDAVWHFALGLGDDNPMWWDPGHPGGQQVPPTFLYSCENAPVVPGLMQTEERGGVDTWLPGALGLWAGDHWIWHERVEVGEPISATTELWKVAERRSSLSARSVAQVTRTVFHGRDDRLLAEVYRSIFRFERSALTDQYMGLEPARYTAEDRERIQRQYLAEAANRRGGEPRLWRDVEVGDKLPTLLKGPLTVTGLVSWVVGWGASMCQSDRIRATVLQRNPGAAIVHPEFGFTDTIEGPHWDSALSHLGRYPRGYDFGCQRLSWLAQCVTDWCGDGGRIAELDGRLLKPNLLGDSTWVTGRVTGKSRDGDRSLVSCALEARNQRDQITASGAAVVELPSRA
ncbi:MAG TPA: hypothetical protein VHC18_12610 [Amycolatopsis sp.]|nr:hypothetical protein [Amycolatopsis sp.]